MLYAISRGVGSVGYGRRKTEGFSKIVCEDDRIKAMIRKIADYKPEGDDDVEVERIWMMQALIGLGKYETLDKLHIKSGRGNGKYKKYELYVSHIKTGTV
jgi:hypothetical protein